MRFMMALDSVNTKFVIYSSTAYWALQATAVYGPCPMSDAMRTPDPMWLSGGCATFCNSKLLVTSLQVCISRVSSTKLYLNAL